MSHFKDAWQHVRRSPIQSLVATLVMFMAFLSVSLFGSLVFGFSSVLKYFESRPEITIFLKDKVTNSAIEELKKELGDTGLTKEIRHVSKEEALKIYQSENKDNPLLLEMVTADFLPASLEVSANDPKDLEKLALIVDAKKDIVEEVIFQKDLVTSLTKWTTLLRGIGVAVILFLIIMASLVTAIIIGMKISNHKEEIEIKRLLGAGNFFIQAPFLLEGTFYGIVGGALGWLVVFLGFIYLKSRLETFFGGVNLILFSQYFWMILFGFQFLLGLVIGVLGSSLAVKKYLR